MSGVARSLTLASVDTRDAGITEHAFAALADFLGRVKSAKGSLNEGWQVYDEESELILASAAAASMFLSPDLAEKVRPFLDARECISADDTADDYGRGQAVRCIARALVVSLLGAPTPKAKAPAPAPVVVPAADDDAPGVPF